MSRRTAVHVRYTSWYISFLSFVRQQREMTKFCFVYGTCTTTANFLVFPFGIKCCHRIFSLSTSLEPLVYRTLVKYNLLGVVSASSSLIKLPSQSISQLVNLLLISSLILDIKMVACTAAMKNCCDFLNF